MTDPTINKLLKERLPRIYAAGADFNDVNEVQSTVQSLEDWPYVWESIGQRYLQQAESHVLQDQTVSAGEAYSRAALYFHFGQFAYFKGAAVKQRLQLLQNEAYEKALPFLNSNASLLRIPHKDFFISAILKCPTLDRPSPCVVLIPGADSTKEEFQTLERVFHERGFATCSIDGPGQGLTWHASKLCFDYEYPICSVLDVITKNPAVDESKIVLWGRSYGAYACLRASVDSRLMASVAIGGFFELKAIWSRMPESTQESLLYAKGLGPDDQSIQSVLSRYTLEGHLEKISCPVLVVHSGGDEVCPVEESIRTITCLRNKESMLKVFDEGNHVCDNIPHFVRPYMADWLASKVNRS
jgi:alpha-beta hydrolase superfamily lysophospholipase